MALFSVLIVVLSSGVNTASVVGTRHTLVKDHPKAYLAKIVGELI
jgi:hypothetical protein